jgi:hypothetical protein
MNSVLISVDGATISSKRACPSHAPAEAQGYSPVVVISDYSKVQTNDSSNDDGIAEQVTLATDELLRNPQRLAAGQNRWQPA